MPLRVAVEGGGCSGFQYDIKLDEPTPDDLVLEKDGQKVLVDSVSLPFLANAVIDFSRRPDRRPLRGREPERHLVLRLRHLVLDLNRPSAPPPAPVDRPPRGRPPRPASAERQGNVRQRSGT